jgi:hypothetical protein
MSKYVINGVASDDAAKWSSHCAQMLSLYKLLKNHDWDYAMSDDPRVWSRGRDESEKINNMTRQIGLDAQILRFGFRLQCFGPHIGVAYTRDLKLPTLQAADTPQAPEGGGQQPVAETTKFLVWV